MGLLEFTRWAYLLIFFTNFIIFKSVTTKDHCKFREARRSPLDANPMKTHDTPMKQEGMEAKPRKYNIHCLYTSQLTTHIHNHAWCPVFMVDLEITRGGNQYSHLPEVLRKKKKKLTIANSTRSHFWIVKTTLLYRYICIYITFFGLT